MAVKKSSSDKTPSKKKTLAKTKSVVADPHGGSQTHTGQSVTIPEHEIRRRAYELYQARGCQHGFDWDDWIRAEAEIVSRHKESAGAG